MKSPRSRSIGLVVDPSGGDPPCPASGTATLSPLTLDEGGTGTTITYANCRDNLSGTLAVVLYNSTGAVTGSFDVTFNNAVLTIVEPAARGRGPLLSIACNQTSQQQCYVTKLSGDGVSDSMLLVPDCTSSAVGAMVVSSCPTAGLVGCCTLEAGTITGILTEICYYSGPQLCRSRLAPPTATTGAPRNSLTRVYTPARCLFVKLSALSQGHRTTGWSPTAARTVTPPLVVFCATSGERRALVMKTS